MRISVIIPTYNRAADLRECLMSVLAQAVRPAEVLVIDNSDVRAAEVRTVVEELGAALARQGMHLQYIPNRGRNSLTVAKNLGIDRAFGEIVSFLDDDVILDRHYYEEILKVYKSIPHALGVQGKVEVGDTSRVLSTLGYFFGRLFFLGFRERAACRVLPSMGVTYPEGEGVVSCEWLSGAATFRRWVLAEFRPDENLRKYSDNEDVDLSYRIFKMYPGTLFLTSASRYWHKSSHEGRVTGKELIYMQEVYSLYLFFKNIDGTVANRLIYVWSRIGRFAFLVTRAILRLSAADLLGGLHLLGAWVHCLRHLREVRQGDLEFFNRTLA